MHRNTLPRRASRSRQARSDEMYDAAVDADVVLAETPANPGLDVTDLHRLSLICRGRGARLIVDNTTATPLGQLPLSLGADLVVASATKALSGHSDMLAGYVAGSHPDLMDTAGSRTAAVRAHSRRLRGVAAAAQPRQRRAAVRAAVPQRDRTGELAARPPGLRDLSRRLLPRHLGAAAPRDDPRCRDRGGRGLARDAGGAAARGPGPAVPARGDVPGLVGAS